MAILSTTLDTTATTLYSSVGETVVTSLYFCNTSTASLTFNMYLVPAGNTASPSNIVYYAVEIAPTDTYVIDTEKIIFADGDMIQANSTAGSAIVATISSMRY